MATIDSYLKIDGIDGESKHKDAVGQIEIQQFAWNIDNAASATVGGGSGVGKAVPGLFTFMHVYDKASPTLAKSCASGKHLANAKLTVSKAGEGQKEFLTVTMKEVMVVSVGLSGSGGGEVSESVSLSYADIEFEYKPQDDKGALGGGVKFGLDCKSTEVR
ncbi:Hcp1 family type VI secretion system effector [Caballeronia terrestris]|jgi:type VI secretion system secreted protein Hcp|uniref:Hcp1 family type VI secretion system effector n=1 Tax=Caballeronia terrestris TaxID=1226301 RepID=A0A158GCB1_9BURK|nr:type VI secretion system tube protein Hcp [Caballeronia terrestris]SAL29020.1 Hcp1 family type VI secretion system effector [Caballeronia terrestris]